MLQTGHIAQWHDDKGWGLIQPDSGDARLFFHIKTFEPRGRRPIADLRVTYTAGSDVKGRPCAVAVKAPEWMSAGPAAATRRPPQARATGGSGGTELALAVVILVAIVAGAWWFTGLKWLAVAYAIMSVVSLLAYNLDKSRAERGVHRTPENTLLALDLACGWPGGLLAQELFRHKNRKTSYQIRFWLVVVANTATVAYAHSQGLLQGLMPS